MKTSAISRLALGLSALALVTACASQPKAEPPPPAIETPRAPDPTPPTPPAPPIVNQVPNVPVIPSIVPGTLEDFSVNVGDRVYFDTDMHTLKPEARVVLDRQAAWLKMFPSTRIMVAGNADERGTREYNLALGARRAEAVRNYLIASGVEANRLDTVSYGKERPIDPGTNEAAWALNRNAQSQVVSGAVS
jgi:peptidoglycan-associated lipoprotein